MYLFFFFFQAEDGIRDIGVTGVQTCALPISLGAATLGLAFAGLTLAITGTVLAISAASNAIGNFGSKVASTFKNTMNNAVTSANNAFNKVANIFRKEIRMNIKLPKINVSGAFSGNPLQVPTFSLSWYKTGGIFTGPSVIGVGESGDEAVLPLSNKRRMKPFANAVASMISVDKPTQPAYQGVTIKDRKSTRLNSSHANISYAVFCLKKKND